MNIEKFIKINIRFYLCLSPYVALEYLIKYINEILKKKIDYVIINFKSH